jgi:hypothetical protein
MGREESSMFSLSPNWKEGKEVGKWLACSRMQFLNNHSEANQHEWSPVTVAICLGLLAQR